MKRTLLALILAATAGGLHAQSAASIQIQADQPGHAISPMLWGIFFEDINLSADGGIYAEQVRNRSFEDTDQPEHWSLAPKGSAKGAMKVSLEKPAGADMLRTRNRRSLQVDIAEADAANGVAVANEGYWGIAVKAGASYDLAFHARAASGFSSLTVSLESADGKVYASKTVKGLGADWKGFKLEFKSAGTDAKARLVFTANAKGTFWLDMVSLFPRDTWKGHGLRTDLMEMLADLKPAFIRFPGGCWVEGDTMREAYRWKETMGDIWERRTQWNIWQYWATHGIGYHEYLQMCEDLGSEPLFVINCGMSHKENVPMTQMGAFVQDALDAIEYANGSVKSPWGALRAKNGHPAPFNLKYLEIGNENGGPAYHERYALMYKAIKDRYPEINLIANEWSGIPKSAPVEIVDEHYYNNPEFFIRQAGRYDSYDRQGHKVYVGEYAVTQNTGKGNLRGAVGEAAFMLGMERNSDVVVMSSYAPLFVHLNHRKWNPDLINYDSTGAYGIPSYYVQQLFGQNRGDVVLPTEVSTPQTEAGPAGGAIGVGTWWTQAEFKDIKVTKGNETLFSSDFSQGTKGWRMLGGGKWKAQEGVLRQEGTNDNVRALIGDAKWTDYTLTLKARKLSGLEGFLVLFNVQDDGAKSWWNLGGWGNKRHAIEMGGVMGNEADGSIETGRWYDIRVECKGQSVKCYLDGKLVNQASSPTIKSIYASASKDKATGETIIKVVNTAATALETEIKLKGVTSVTSPATLMVLTSGSSTDENTLAMPKRVATVTSPLNVAGPVFKHAFPGNSVNVIRLKTP